MSNSNDHEYYTKWPVYNGLHRQNMSISLILLISWQKSFLFFDCITGVCSCRLCVLSAFNYSQSNANCYYIVTFIHWFSVTSISQLTEPKISKLVEVRDDDDHTFRWAFKIKGNELECGKNGHIGNVRKAVGNCPRRYNFDQVWRQGLVFWIE